MGTKWERCPCARAPRSVSVRGLWVDHADHDRSRHVGGDLAVGHDVAIGKMRHLRTISGLEGDVPKRQTGAGSLLPDHYGGHMPGGSDGRRGKHDRHREHRASSADPDRRAEDLPARRALCHRQMLGRRPRWPETRPSQRIARLPLGAALRPDMVGRAHEPGRSEQGHGRCIRAVRLPGLMAQVRLSLGTGASTGLSCDALGVPRSWSEPSVSTGKCRESQEYLNRLKCRRRCICERASSRL